MPDILRGSRASSTRNYPREGLAGRLRGVELAENSAHHIRGLGAGPEPVLHAISLELDGTLFGEGVIRAEFLKETTVSRVASVVATIR